MNKKIFKYVIMLVIAITGVVAVSSCSSDDDDETASKLNGKLDGKWTLVKYAQGDSTWGEYAEITGNIMVWNSRLEGEDSKYELTYDTDSTFSAKCVYSSIDHYDGNDWSFTVTKCTPDSLITVDSYGYTRVFASVKSK